MSGRILLSLLYATLDDAHSHEPCLPGIVKMRKLSKEFVRLYTLKLHINPVLTNF
jgi:hypothetical protein